MRLSRVLCFLLLLTSCGAIGPGGEGSRALVVTDQKIRLTAPPGYCADLPSSQIDAQKAFVVYGRCSDGDRPASDKMSIVTVSTAQTRQKVDPAEFARFIQTQTGKTTLSVRDAPQDINIIQSFIRDGAVYLRISETQNVAGLSPDH